MGRVGQAVESTTCPTGGLLLERKETAATMTAFWAKSADSKQALKNNMGDVDLGAHVAPTTRNKQATKFGQSVAKEPGLTQPIE